MVCDLTRQCLATDAAKIVNNSHRKKKWPTEAGPG